jgi:hypothetical protein
MAVVAEARNLNTSFGHERTSNVLKGLPRLKAYAMYVTKRKVSYKYKDLDLGKANVRRTSAGGYSHGDYPAGIYTRAEELPVR